MSADRMTNTSLRHSAPGSNFIRLKAVRTDRELQCPQIDFGLVGRGLNLVALPKNISEERLTNPEHRASAVIQPDWIGELGAIL